MSEPMTDRRPTPLEAIKALRSATSEFRRYVLASALALGVDFGLLYLLTQYAGFHYITAATISYCTGALVHYVISINLVFRNRSVADRRIEFAAFFAVGLLGLGATQLVLKIAVEGLGLNVMVGKAAATGVSFGLNFLVRKLVLFRVPRLSR